MKESRKQAIEALAGRGLGERDIARRLGVGESYVQYVVRFWRYERNGKATRDETCPKFAHHDEHVRDCLARGGFVAMVFRPARRRVAVVMQALGMWRAGPATMDIEDLEAA